MLKVTLSFSAVEKNIFIKLQSVYTLVQVCSLLFSRSDFVTLPFQGAEVLLDNIAPLPGTVWKSLWGDSGVPT